MKRRRRLASLTLVIAMSAATADAQLLQNDTWESGEPVEFQAGLISGEIAASRLYPPQGACPCRVTSVSFLFGGSAGTRDVTIRIWDDTDEELAPGDSLLTKTVSVVPNALNPKVVNVSADDVVVFGAFRVGITMHGDGLPSVASDDDGTVFTARNFLFSDGWFDASTIGLSGDWIIRANVEPIEQTRCAQPLSDGNAPVASDCLHILRSAVGTSTCDPSCVCDPNASLSVTASDALLCLRKAVGQSVMLDCPCP